MSRIATLDPTTAPGEAGTFLAAITAKFGSTPNFFRTIAHAPAVANAFVAFNGALANTRLSVQQREIIALTQAGLHGCPYCGAYHVFAATKAGMPREQALAWLKGEMPGTADAALARFAHTVLTHRGRISDEDLADLRNHGFDDGHVIDIMAVIAANVFTNFVNLAAQTDVDFPAVSGL